MSLDKWVNGEIRESQKAKEVGNSLDRSRTLLTEISDSKPLTCKYYDEKTNKCPHYERGGRCHKLLITCGLSKQLEEN